MGKSTIGHVERVSDGVWRIRVQRGTDIDGRPRVRSETFRGTKEEARARAAAMASEMGRTLDGMGGMTLREYWVAIFPSKPSNRGTPRSAVTMDWYRRRMEKDVLPRIGDVPLSRLTHAQVRDCILSASSPTNCKRTLSAVLRSAYDDGLMPERPMERRIPVHRERRERPLPWSRFEVAAALDALASAPWPVRAYLCLGLSGLREEESLAVRPVDIREQSTYSFATGEELRTVTVTVAQVWTEPGGVVPRAKNDWSLRTVPVLGACREMLAEAVAESRSSWDGDPEAWAGERVIRLTRHQLYLRWKAALSGARLRYIPPDVLRHTSDTLALTAGVSPDLNDKMHGRAEHTSTYRHYFRPDAGAAEAASQAVSDLVRPHCVQPSDGDSDGIRQNGEPA